MKRAPRLSASMPTAPVPENKSSQSESGVRGATTLKRVSRRRSLVGRSSTPGGGACSLRLRNLPAITRMGYAAKQRSGEACAYTICAASNPREEPARHERDEDMVHPPGRISRGTCAPAPQFFCLARLPGTGSAGQGQRGGSGRGGYVLRPDRGGGVRARVGTLTGVPHA